MGPIEVFLYLLYRFVLYVWRSTLKRGRFSRLYDFASDSPYENGALIPRVEFDEELPRSRTVSVTAEPSPQEQLRTDDTIQIFGQNAHGQLLLAGIQRIPEGRALVTLYVRLKCGRSFRLTQPLHVDTSAEEHFAAGGLRITCIHPMRRWRVSFNGTLVEIGADPKLVQTAHVKLVAIGNLAHGCADFQSYFNESFIAGQLARRAGFGAINKNRLEKGLKSIDTYYQRFSFASKVFVECGPAEEMFLFGYKNRSRGTSTYVKKSIVAFTENGISSVILITALPGIMSDAVLGYINFPNRQQRALQFCSDVDEFFQPGRLAVEVGAESWETLRLAELDVADEIELFDWRNEMMLEKRLKFCRISFDGNPGYALICNVTGSTACLQMNPVPRYVAMTRPAPTEAGHRPLVLSFRDAACTQTSLCGGKGSSLAVLTQIADDHPNLFCVPEGLCVTTAAYKLFVSSDNVADALCELENIVASQPTLKKLREACDRIRLVIAAAELPETIVSKLSSKLNPSLCYAIRSSACGEDSDETSAAGQMETILGVQGLQPIMQAIVRCWASQFSFVALQYRRRYGQAVNVPMCVVVQEMVASDVSGVMFSVDPVSGDCRRIVITANYGLGESVVSASADPDTFIVAKCGKDAASLEFVREELGEKKLRTVLADAGGTQDVIDNTGSSTACLTRDQVMRLAEVALMLERCYAAPRDTEWAFYKNTLYMLQARPVTSLDQIDTEFEFFHESDQGMDSEIDALSKANVGEVFGGSMSTLSLDVIHTALKGMRIGAQMWNGEPDFTYARSLFLHTYNSQCFFPTYWPGLADYTSDDLLSLSISLSMAGRLIDDECVRISNRNKRRYQFAASSHDGPLRALMDFWTAESTLEKTRTTLTDYKAGMNLNQFTDSHQLFFHILGELHIFEQAFLSHEKLIFYGSMTNICILSLLAYCNNGEWNQNVYADFATLTTSCRESIESAGVPTSMVRLAQRIEAHFGKTFRGLPVSEALAALRNCQNEVGNLFKTFLTNHGHRCMREFDVQSKSWAMDPSPLVRSLQKMVGATTIVNSKKGLTDDELIDSLNIRLPHMYRSVLKFILKRVRKGIALRESGKSLAVLGNEILRMYFWRLAQIMMSEGRLPEEDLLFHLTLPEIDELLKTRAPKLLIRARHRRTNQKRADGFIYLEHTAGQPLLPLNGAANDDVRLRPELGSLLMKGTPICAGSVKAPVRVVVTLDDADQIQQGDILVTYATDVGWSPYFPLLAGIVTELGGLISHGAVIAREFGLPSIVGVHGATRMFKSGQIAILEGSKGTIGLAECNDTLDMTSN